MPQPKPDRRIARTRDSLHRSLNKLILEKGYEAVTIKDLVSHANVGRSTFYAHHGSKEGLLLSGLEHLHEALINQRSKVPAVPSGESTPVLGFSCVFFEHVYEYRDVFRALAENPTGAIVTHRIKRLLTDVVRNDLSKAKIDAGSEIPREAAVRFVVDALYSVLLWWLEQSPRLPAVEADAIFRRLTLPGLAAIGLTRSPAPHHS
jgi:AcrR family transcriptional regulator